MFQTGYKPVLQLHHHLAKVLPILILFSFCSCFAATASSAEAQNERLNFIIILVDDLGWMDLSCQGSRFYETPNIDRLATQGLRFTNAYAACAVCSPTRAAVMTGRYPARVGITDWIRARFQRGRVGTPEKNRTEFVGGPNRKLLCPPNPYWLEHDEITIAEALKPAGYVTCHIGKWHLGDDDWYPQRQGFDFNFGGCDYGQPPSYFDPFQNKRLSVGIPHLPPRKKGEYLTDREADEAVNFIRQHKHKPFFLYMAHYAVHTPIQAREDLTAKYVAKPKTNQTDAKYAAMIHSVDDSTGRIMQALKEANIDERTVIIFTSDNGGLDRNGRPTDNAPLRSGKGYPYEGGIRVPLIIRWPGVAGPGTLSHEPVCSIDYFPTILDAARVSLPTNHEIDGLSLVGHLRSSGKKRLERSSLYWHFPHYRHPPGPYSIVRSRDWKLIKYYDGPQLELYQLADDLSETKNLSESMPGKARQLDGELLTHLKSVRARLPKANPKYAP